MAMNVTNSYTNAASSYDKYAVEKEKAEAIKESAKEPKSQTDYSKEAEVFFSHESVKALYDSTSFKTAEDIQWVGTNRINTWLDKNGYSGNNTLFHMNSSQEADVYTRMYAELYDEIERGYAEGTRKIYVNDPSAQGGNKVRLLTREEELASLDKVYNEWCVGKVAEKRRSEIDGELIKQGKMSNRWDAILNSKSKPKNAIPSETYGQNTSEDVKDFINERKDKSAAEIRSEGTDVFINKITQNMLDITNLFKQQYSQQKPGTFDIAGFLKNLSYWK